MRNVRAFLLAAAVAGLTIAGGASASAEPLSSQVQASSSSSSWVEPEVIAPARSSIPKLSVTLIWGWRP